jgi:hypothetical protein
MMATFGADSLGFGTLSGWVIQDATADDENKRANVLDAVGNEAAANLFDDTTQVTTTYKASSSDPTSGPSIPDLGEDVGGVTVTSISLSTDAEDYATMTLTGHEHIDGGHGTVRNVAHGIALDRAFGASAFGVSGGDSIRSSECTISCEHIDVPGDDGATKAGENYDPKVEITVRVLGSGASLDAAYDRIGDSTEGSNTDFQYQTLRGYKKLSFS